MLPGNPCALAVQGQGECLVPVDDRGRDVVYRRDGPLSGRLLHHGNVLRVQVAVARQPRKCRLEGQIPHRGQRCRAIRRKRMAHLPVSHVVLVRRVEAQHLRTVLDGEPLHGPRRPGRRLGPRHAGDRPTGYSATGHRHPVEAFHEQPGPPGDVADQLDPAQRDPQPRRVPEHRVLVFDDVRELGRVEFEDVAPAGAGHRHGDHSSGQLVLHPRQGHRVDQPGVAQQGLEIHGRCGVKLDGVLVRVQLLAVADDLHVTHRVGTGRDEQGQLIIHAGLDGTAQRIQPPALRQKPGEIRRGRPRRGQYGFRS
ncbi:hypothetical protein SRABI128_04809 [Microbacterium sp. Bi128]|nr:hypothetical protein SRABI128_04809 [Microbacterium sp. Bi128]